MKKIMIILIPLILIACTTNNADYVTKQEFGEYKSSMENLFQASNDSINKTQKEILSKTDDHQLNINTLTIDLNSLYQTVSTAQKYEENDVLKKLVGKVAALEYELEQFKNNNSSAEHTHSSVPSHTHTTSSSTSVSSHTHTSIPNHTHTASGSGSIPSHTHTSIPNHTHTASSFIPSHTHGKGDVPNSTLSSMAYDLRQICRANVQETIESWGVPDRTILKKLVKCTGGY